VASNAATAAKTVIQLVAAESQHVNELGRICYEAFKDLHDRHGFPLDFISAAHARQVIGMMVERDDFYGVAAILDGELVGSNFLSLTDPVAGVGPITVDCAFRGRNVGRALMQNVIDYAQHNGIARVRLMQETFNALSLSLYASLGFDVQEEVAFMEAAPTDAADYSVRAATEADLPAIERLSTDIYKARRSNEVAGAVRYGFSPLLRERDGRIVGYLVPGIFGHGVAETEDDAVTLVGEMARRLPGEQARFFCPLSEHDFFRRALKLGCRTRSVFSLMTLGPYAPPRQVWMPSVLY
jgi:ribosomal protein S18 acetylase RimI-like enzyme